MKKTRKQEKKKTNINFYKIIGILLIITSAIFTGVLFYLNLLPTKYMSMIVTIIIIFNLFTIILLNLKRLKKKIKKTISIFAMLVITIFILASIYMFKTLGVLVNNGDTKYKLEHYSLIVLNDSNYNDIDDLNDELIGYYKNSAGSNQAIQYLNKKIKADYEGNIDSNTLVKDLLSSKLDVILLEDSIKNIMLEEYDSFSSSIKTIYSFTIKVSSESTLKDVNVTKQPFAVYISGIDTYGQISSVSRSDVNMLLVANPETKQILLISIPRDYYVQLHGTEGVKDKITHAGIYGIEMSIQTIEDLLDLDINYYLKVNFTSVIDIVDALGGLDVYSEYSFISYSGFSFKKGYNRVNGEQALDFARTRKAFSTGDRQRGKNQQALIEAVIRKFASKSIIMKYTSLLDAVDGKYQTNMSLKKITSLIKMQLNDMSSWNITSYSLTGRDSKDYTYTYYQLLYVMEPDEESVNEAISLIDRVIAGEILDSSYGEVSGTSKNVSKVPNNQNIQQEPDVSDKEEKNEEISDSSDLDEDEKNENLEDEEEIKNDEDGESKEIPKEDNNEENSNQDLENSDDSNGDNNDDNIIDNPANSLIPTPET